MIDPPTLLGSAYWDALVPYQPAHWAELRGRDVVAAHALKVADDGLAEVLAMSVLACTVLVDGRPECIVGLMLTPDDGHPWVMAPNPHIARFARATRLSEQFIERCFEHRAILRLEQSEFDNSTRMWLSGLRFNLTRLHGPLECWERRVGRG